MRKILFFIFLITFAVTFYIKDSYKWITDFDPHIYNEPVQTETNDTEPIQFKKDRFAYKVTPLYQYDISGLVVHAQRYNTWYSLSRVDRVFPMDICMIWGRNITEGGYRAWGSTVAQDFRFCLFSYTGGHEIRNDSLSNNHLVIQNPAIDAVAKSIEAGDQIEIIGKLVNVDAQPLVSPEAYEPSDLHWPSSVTRTDSGAGACETIYIESIKILKKGNPTLHLLYNISFYGLGIVAFWWLVDFALVLGRDRTSARILNNL